MTDIERILMAVGDLELSRRQLLFRVQELETENAELKAKLNGDSNPVTEPVATGGKK